MTELSPDAGRTAFGLPGDVTSPAAFVTTADGRTLLLYTTAGKQGGYDVERAYARPVF